MSASKNETATKEMNWTPALIRMLRGKRTLVEFGELIGAPKNTVWRWEAGYVKPETSYSAKLQKLAEREHFLEEWQLVGSMEIVGDVERGSKEVSKSLKASRDKNIRDLTN